MGLYYNPQPPHIGAAQPVTPKSLTPPVSGPAPQNPPLVGARIALAALIAWLPPAPQPPVARNLTPPSAPASQAPVNGGARVPAGVLQWWLPPAPTSPVAPLLVQGGPASQNPPFAGGASVPDAVLVAWVPPLPHPPTPRNLTPLPSSQNPPFAGGAEVSQAVLLSWLPAPPLPLVAINLDPPISGPTPQNPPFAGGLEIGWLDTAWPVIPASRIAPLVPAQSAQYVPPGAQVPVAAAIAWLQPQQPPIVAVNLDPPISGPASQNPPFAGGAKIPAAVPVWWIPPSPQPVSKTPFVGLSPPPPSPSASAFDAPFIANLGKFMHRRS